MKRNFTLFAAFLALVAALTGCQLAKEEAESAASDQLVGVYITNEYLDLFDMEAWLNDNWNGQETMTVEGNTRPYEGRIYGQNVSTDPAHPDYVFPGAEGVPIWSIPVEDEHGEICWTPSGAPEAPFHSAYHVGDDMDGMTLTADLYVDCTQPIHSFYANPIYRTAAGEVYLMAEAGMSGDMSVPGTSMSTNLAEETTVTLAGETKTQRTEIDVTIHAAQPVTEVVLVQMDGENRVVRRDVYAAEDLPAEYTLLDSAAYLVAESHSGDTIQRELYDREDDTLLLYTDASKGYLVQSAVTLAWQ